MTRPPDIFVAAYVRRSGFGADLTRAVVEDDGPPALLNVNVPGSTAKGVRVGTLGRRDYPERGNPRGTRGEWTLYEIGGGLLRDRLLPGSDGEAIDQGWISVTPLAIDQTARERLDDAKRLLAKVPVSS